MAYRTTEEVVNDVRTHQDHGDIGGEQAIPNGRVPGCSCGDLFVRPELRFELRRESRQISDERVFAQIGAVVMAIAHEDANGAHGYPLLYGKIAL